MSEMIANPLVRGLIPGYRSLVDAFGDPVGFPVEESDILKSVRKRMGLTTATSDYFLKSWLLPLFASPDCLEFAVSGNTLVSLRHSFIDPLLHFEREMARVTGGYVSTGFTPSRLDWRPTVTPPSGYFGFDYVDDTKVALRFANQAGATYIRYYKLGNGVIALDLDELDEVLPGVVLSFSPLSEWEAGSKIRFYIEPASFLYAAVLFREDQRIDSDVSLVLNEVGVLDAFIATPDIYRKAALLAAAVIKLTLRGRTLIPGIDFEFPPAIPGDFPTPPDPDIPDPEPPIPIPSVMLNGDLIFLNGIQIIIS
jgi:hypothetical protein